MHVVEIFVYTPKETYHALALWQIVYLMKFNKNVYETVQKITEVVSVNNVSTADVSLADKTSSITNLRRIAKSIPAKSKMYAEETSVPMIRVS